VVFVDGIHEATDDEMLDDPHTLIGAMLGYRQRFMWFYHGKIYLRPTINIRTYKD
jgi:hypothetical protein